MTTQGNRIHQIRKKLNLKQSEFGTVFGCSHAFISAVENDKNKLSVDNLLKLLVEYNVNINYVLAGKGSMFLEQQEIPHQSDIDEDRIRQICYKLLKEQGLI